MDDLQWTKIDLGIHFLSIYTTGCLNLVVSTHQKWSKQYIFNTILRCFILQFAQLVFNSLILNYCLYTNFMVLRTHDAFIFNPLYWNLDFNRSNWFPNEWENVIHFQVCLIGSVVFLRSRQHWLWRAASFRPLLVTEDFCAGTVKKLYLFLTRNLGFCVSSEGLPWVISCTTSKGNGAPVLTGIRMDVEILDKIDHMDSLLVVHKTN